MEQEPAIVRLYVDATGRLVFVIPDYINSVTIRREGLIEEEKFVSFKTKRPRTFFLPKERDIDVKFTTLSVAYAIIANLPYIIATIVVHRCTILRECTPSLHYIMKSA